MKTILHLIETSGPGGAEQMLISLVQHLDRESYRSIVCLLKDGWLSTQLREGGIETVVLPQHGVCDAMWLYRLVALIRRRHIALMHTHEFTMNVYGAAASLLTRIPVISTVHGKNYYPDKWRRRAAYRLVARRSTLVAVSEDIRRFLTDRLGISNARTTTVYNGIDLDRYRGDAQWKGRVRARLRLGDRPVIGTVGNLYPVKGHQYLVEAAALVAARCPEAVFVVAGRGHLLESLQNKVRALGLADNVIFLGFEGDIPSLLQAMDIFVLPSLSEGLPLSVLEAMAAAKPVVATRVGGNSEVVVDGHTGFLVPTKDPAALAMRILQLLRDTDLRNEFAHCGRRRVEEEFALQTMLHRYQALYSRRLDDGHPRHVEQPYASHVREY